MSIESDLEKFNKKLTQSPPGKKPTAKKIIKKKVSAMQRKEGMRIKMVFVLSDVENDMISRKDLAIKVLGFKKKEVIYKYFTAPELDALYDEALANRRKQYTPRFSKIDDAVLNLAEDGNMTAATLIYKKFESLDKHHVEHSVAPELIKTILDALPEEFRDSVLEKIKNKFEG